ncbi:MAG: quinone-dependent dihydroorotate dehydrogenase [Ignavibacteria bacterium]|nr:quinone-dependent dihydroorotate dehydrogenase [Ignavibacteria bacterium]
MYKSIIRPLLFTIDPERAHELALGMITKLKLAYPLFHSGYSPVNNDPVKIGPLTFRNRLGLAAGFDKNGTAIEFWDALGFSHVEVGTVTPLPQPGNELPRIFRLPKDSALINRLGFNNRGADAVRTNILKARKKVSNDFVIGVNIGKNKSTPVEDAVKDYTTCFEKMYDAADYFTVNVSSPNTPGLWQLQDEEHLAELLSKISALNNSISSQKQVRNKDIFLKIAPDINDETLHSIFNICTANEITGIIATNTTIGRTGLQTVIDQQGGLSGKPVFGKSNEVLGKLNELRKASSHKTPELIGVGGVFTKSDYKEKLRLGASLVQVYTGFVYEGPGMIKELLNS